MYYWYVQQYGWISKELCWVKEATIKVHSKLSFSYKNLENENRFVVSECRLGVAWWFSGRHGGIAGWENLEKMNIFIILLSWFYRWDRY